MFDGWPRRLHQRRTITVLATVAALIALLGSTPQAAAKEFKDPTHPKATKHLQQGNRHYKVREFKKAIVEYKAGALVEDVPIFLYNLGQSYRQLSKFKDAIWYYGRYLSQGTPSAARKKWVEDTIKEMKSDVRKKPPTGPGAEHIKPPPIKTKPKNTETKPDEPLVSPSPEHDHVAWHADKLGWIITGSGAVGLVLGAGLFTNASSLDDQAAAEDDQNERIRLRDLGDSRRTLGLVSTAVGLALVAGGVYRLLSNPQPKPADDDDTTVSLAAGARWVGLVGRF